VHVLRAALRRSDADRASQLQLVEPPAPLALAEEQRGAADIDADLVAAGVDEDEVARRLAVCCPGGRPGSAKREVYCTATTDSPPMFSTVSTSMSTTPQPDQANDCNGIQAETLTLDTAKN